MILDFSTLSPVQRYHWMTQTIIPRPIAWVLSENVAGSFNLAPFSYFNALSSAPPLIGISFGLTPDGAEKDTLINIRRRRHFVVHIASTDFIDAVNQSAASFIYGESEVSALGLETTPFGDMFALPRLCDATVAFACHFQQAIALSDVQTLMIGEVNHLYLAQTLMEEDDAGRPMVNPKKVNPLLRLGASQYSGLSDIITRKRPQ